MRGVKINRMRWEGCLEIFFQYKTCLCWKLLMMFPSCFRKWKNMEYVLYSRCHCQQSNWWALMSLLSCCLSFNGSPFLMPGKMTGWLFVGKKKNICIKLLICISVYSAVLYRFIKLLSFQCVKWKRDISLKVSRLLFANRAVFFLQHLNL